MAKKASIHRFYGLMPFYLHGNSCDSEVSLFFVILRDYVDGCYTVAFFQVLNAYALGASGLLRGNISYPYLDGYALFGYPHQVIIIYSGDDSYYFISTTESKSD